MVESLQYSRYDYLVFSILSPPVPNHLEEVKDSAEEEAPVNIKKPMPHNSGALRIIHGCNGR